MSELYGEIVAKCCDIAYEKLFDTEEEISFLSWVFQHFAGIEVRDILDVACGTGRHAIPLARRGYTVTGADASQAMLNIMRERAATANLHVPHLRCDMRYLPFNQEAFDGLVCMYTAFHYLLTTEDILRALKVFHRVIRPCGILVLDLFNPLYYLGRFQEVSVEHHQEGELAIQRTFKHKIDEVKAIWHQDEFAIIKDKDGISMYHEVHSMRMLTYPEVSYLLKQTGFADTRCFGGLASREEATDTAQRLVVVANKIGGAKT